MLSKEQLKQLNEFFENGETELQSDQKYHFIKTENREEVRGFLFEHLYCSNDFDHLTKKQLSNNKFKVVKNVKTFGIVRGCIEKHGKVLYV